MLILLIALASVDVEESFVVDCRGIDSLLVHSRQVPRLLRPCVVPSVGQNLSKLGRCFKSTTFPKASDNIHHSTICSEAEKLDGLW